MYYIITRIWPNLFLLHSGENVIWLFYTKYIKAITLLHFLYVHVLLYSFIEPQRQKTYRSSDKCAQRSLKLACASTQSDQSLHCLHKEIWILGCPKWVQGRFWSDCANVQADQNLHWAHMSKGTIPDVSAHLLFPNIYQMSLLMFNNLWFCFVYLCHSSGGPGH